MSDENTKDRAEHPSRAHGLFEACEKLMTRSTIWFLALPVVTVGGSFLAGLELMVDDSSPTKANVPSGVNADQIASGQVAQPSPLPADSLIKLGNRALEGGNYARAAELYDVAVRAAEKDGEPARALLARHRRSRALLRMGHPGAAQRAANTLRSVSRPGDSLWKHAVLTSVRASAASRDYTELLSHLYKLLANWRRYQDGAALANWARYRTALARVQMLKREHASESFPYDLNLSFTVTEPAVDPLTVEQIEQTTQESIEEDLKLTLNDGRMTLVIEGATVRRVVKALGQNLGYELAVQTGGQRQVHAKLENLPVETALDLALGSVGLCAKVNDDSGKVEAMRPASGGKRKLARQALVDLQKYLMRYPDSPRTPRVYLALACVHLLQDRNRLALDQLRVIEKQFPDASCDAEGLYIGGRICRELGEPERAKQMLGSAALEFKDEPKAASAKAWAARCQLEQEEYGDARRGFEGALKGGLTDSAKARCLYELALCLEKTNAPRSKIEDRFRKVAVRHPDSKWADPAGYRLARLAFDAGDYSAAMQRYEDYLAREMPEAQKAEEACVELLRSYLETGRSIRAASLGGTLQSVLDDDKDSEIMPLLLKAYRRAGLERLGLQALNRKLGDGPWGPDEAPLLMEKARLLFDLKRCEKARTTLDKVENIEEAAIERDAIRLLRARTFLTDEQYKQAGKLCRRIALDSDSEDLRAQACELLGRCFEEREQFDWAARAYSGHCPTSSLEGKW